MSTDQRIVRGIPPQKDNGEFLYPYVPDNDPNVTYVALIILACCAFGGILATMVM